MAFYTGWEKEVGTEQYSAEIITDQEEPKKPMGECGTAGCPCGTYDCEEGFPTNFTPEEEEELQAQGIDPEDYVMTIGDTPLRTLIDNLYEEYPTADIYVEISLRVNVANESAVVDPRLPERILNTLREELDVSDADPAIYHTTEDSNYERSRHDYGNENGSSDFTRVYASASVRVSTPEEETSDSDDSETETF